MKNLIHTSPRRSAEMALPSFRRIALLRIGLLATVFILAGCATPPSIPVGTSLAWRRAAAATDAGFSAVYDGRLRMGFHSWQAIWAIAVAPQGTGMTAAVLSPVGVKIMQLRGTSPTNIECVLSLPGTERLRPYADSLWKALRWSVADNLAEDRIQWSRFATHDEGVATSASVQVLYRVAGEGTNFLGKDTRENGRRQFKIEYDNPCLKGDLQYPGTIRVESRKPRWRLTLNLKDLRPFQTNPGTSDATGP